MLHVLCFVEKVEEHTKALIFMSTGALSMLCIFYEFHLLRFLDIMVELCLHVLCFTEKVEEHTKASIFISKKR